MVQTISSQKSEQIRDGEEAKDLILDIQFDAFGKRFATASSDQKIRIYKRCDNGKYKLETSWQAHSATIWHLDWAHPHHGIILASCSFDKYLRTWMPPVQKNTDFNKRGHHNRDYAQEWEMTGDDCVDRRASVTDVRFSPVWFDPGREKKLAEGASDSTKDKGYSAHCYLACCTLDGTAKVYTNRKSTTSSAENLKSFHDDKQLQILRNSGNFKCSSLDWSRLRNYDQLIAIGGSGKDDKDNLIVLKFTEPTGGTSESTQEESRAWTQLTTKLDIDWRGPVNIVRFAPNAGKHHVLAVGAKDVHVIHITQTVDKTPNKFKFEPQKMISDQLNKINLEKCWRLAWDSIGSSLYTTHGSKTMLCWTRQYTNDKESWNAKTVENQT